MVLRRPPSQDGGDREADDATGDSTDPPQSGRSVGGPRGDASDAWKIDYEEGDGAPRRRRRDTTKKRRPRLLCGPTSESLVMRRSAPATSSSAEEPGSTFSTGTGCSAESIDNCCSSRTTVSSGSERSPRASVAKRGSTSTSSGLTISGWFPVATIRDLYPSNEGRYVGDERLAGDEGWRHCQCSARNECVCQTLSAASAAAQSDRRLLARRKRTGLVEQVPGYVIRGWGDCGLGRRNVTRTLAVLH